MTFRIAHKMMENRRPGCTTLPVSGDLPNLLQRTPCAVPAQTATGSFIIGSAGSRTQRVVRQCADVRANHRADGGPGARICQITTQPAFASEPNRTDMRQRQCQRGRTPELSEC